MNRHIAMSTSGQRSVISAWHSVLGTRHAARSTEHALRTRHSPRRRRGLNLIELLIALSITAVLLTATLVALNASFMAYQSTTEQASTHTIGRLIMHRVQALIRSGRDFGPFPVNPQDSIVASSFIEVINPVGQIVTVRFDESSKALYVQVDDDDEQLLLEGVEPRYDDDGDLIPPFTLEYRLGRKLYRATIDLSIVPDDNMSVSLDGDYAPTIRLVASAMPRSATF